MTSKNQSNHSQQPPLGINKEVINPCADRKTEPNGNNLSFGLEKQKSGSVPNQEENKIAHFISNFEYYDLEKSGNKNYTIRNLNKKIESKLKDATHILIRKGYTSESFVRKISYMLKWKDNIIISWREE